MSALEQLLARIDRLTQTGTIGDGMVAQLQELASRVRGEQRAELLAEEWSETRRGPGSGPMSSGGDGALYPACPGCGGLRDPCEDFIPEAVGHRSGCIIAAALGRPTTDGRPPQRSTL